MSYRILAAAAVIALPLAGCLSEQRASRDDGYCQSIGAKPGEDRYIQCRLQLRSEQEHRRARSLAVMDDSFAGAARSIRPPGGSSLTCTSRPGIGVGVTETDCR